MCIRDRCCILDTKGNGFISKTVHFLGKAAHAGFAPEQGINALNMAELAMNNIHALRETFRDEPRRCELLGEISLLSPG